MANRTPPGFLHVVHVVHVVQTTVVDTRATGEGGKKRRLEEKKGTNNINTNTGTATEKRSSSKPQRRANKNRPQEVSSCLAADASKGFAHVQGPTEHKTATEKTYYSANMLSSG